MTTKHSPLRILRAQADRIADMICKTERGEPVDASFAAKIAEARSKEAVKIGIVMDDKVITLELPWSVIRSSGRVALAAYVLDQMRETRRVIN